MRRIPEEDLRLVVEKTHPLWDKVRNGSLLITGGTGFFGVWLLESLCFINRELGSNLTTSVLSRNPSAFLDRFPHLRNQRELRFIQGDIRSFSIPGGHFDYIIHGATEASAKMISEAPFEMYATICEGTRHVLDLASQRGCHRLLFHSSGAVYGEQPPEIPLVPENYVGAPNPLHAGAVYGEAKRMAENLCAIHAQTHGLNFSSARCFAFVGPHLHLDTHFAIGNFMRDALAGRDIEIKGDGTPLRSYLYASDLSIWLWTLLFKGQNLSAYNVGSEHGVSIRELAELVVQQSDVNAAVRVAVRPDPNKPTKRYVPSTAKARTELQLECTIPLGQAIRKTLKWHHQHA